MSGIKKRIKQAIKGIAKGRKPGKAAAKQVAKKAAKAVKNEIQKISRPKYRTNTRIGNMASLMASGYHPALGPLAQAAGDWVGNITGMGKYTLKSNTLVGDAGPPSFGGDGSITIRHREFLQDVTSSTAFALTSFALNPGVAATFPWLSSIAALFEEYRMLGLVFEFKSTSGFSVGTTNTALGSVIAATDYDSFDNTFSNKQQMEAYEFSTSCAPFTNMCHGVECKPKFNPLGVQYIRSGAVPANADQHFYDIGNFQLATVGMQAASVIGELWVSYHVKLMKPKLPTPLGQQLLQAHIVESPAASATSLKLLGTSGGVLRSGSTLPVAPGDGIFYLPYVGRYLVVVACASQGGAAPTTQWSWTTGSNLAFTTEFWDNTAFQMGAVSGVVSIAVRVYDVSAAGTGSANQVSLGGCASLTNGATDVWISQISSGLQDRPKIDLESIVRDMKQRLDAIDPPNIDTLTDGVYVPHPPTPISFPLRRR